MNYLGYKSSNYFTGDVVINGDLDVNGNVDISGSITFHGDINFCDAQLNTSNVWACNNIFNIFDNDGLSFIQMTKSPRNLDVVAYLRCDHYKSLAFPFMLFLDPNNSEICRMSTSGLKMKKVFENTEDFTILQDVKAGAAENTLYFYDTNNNPMVQMETDKTYINAIKAFPSTNLNISSESDSLPTTIELHNSRCRLVHNNGSAVFETDYIRNSTSGGDGTTQLTFQPSYMRLEAISPSPSTNFANITINQTSNRVTARPNFDCPNIYLDNIYQNSLSGVSIYDQSGSVKAVNVSNTGTITFNQAYSFPTSSSSIGKVLGLTNTNQLGFIDNSINPVPDSEITLSASSNQTVSTSTNTVLTVYSTVVNQTGGISASGGVVTVATTGYYLCTATIGFGVSQFQTRGWFSLNNSDSTRYGEFCDNHPSSAGPTKWASSAIIFMSAGNTVAVKVRQTTGSDLAIGIGEVTNTPALFSVKLLNQNSLIDNLIVMAPLSTSGATLYIPAATTSQNGYLTSSDKTAYDLVVSRVDQNVKTTSSPYFTKLSVGGDYIATALSRIELRGANASTSGPHMAFYGASDSAPIMQILPWDHNNISLFFDSYFDGANSISSTGLSNYRINKQSNNLAIQFAQGITFGSTISSWTDGINLSSNGNVAMAASQILAKQNGATGIPSYSFSGDANTGLNNPSADVASIVCNGVEQLRLTTSGSSFNGVVTMPNIVLSNVNSSNFYSTGTWAITIGDGTNNFTLSSSSAYYEKIGNMYNCAVRIVWSSKGSASGTIRISLPAAIGSSWGRTCAAFGYCSGITFTNQVVAFGDNPNSHIVLSSLSNSGSTPTDLTATSYSASGQLQFNLRYSTN